MVGIARRSVLRGVAAAALVPLAFGAAAAAAPNAPVGIGAVKRRTLEAAVGSTVRIVSASGYITATLEDVQDLPRALPGHPHAFSAGFRLDGDAVGLLEEGLVDIELTGLRLTGAGVLVAGEPGLRKGVLLVDRRPVSEHLAATRA